MNDLSGRIVYTSRSMCMLNCLSNFAVVTHLITSNVLLLMFLQISTNASIQSSNSALHIASRSMVLNASMTSATDIAIVFVESTGSLSVDGGSPLKVSALGGSVLISSSNVTSTTDSAFVNVSTPFTLQATTDISFESVNLTILGEHILSLLVVCCCNGVELYSSATIFLTWISFVLQNLACDVFVFLVRFRCDLNVCKIYLQHGSPFSNPAPRTVSHVPCTYIHNRLMQ